MGGRATGGLKVTEEFIFFVPVHGWSSLIGAFLVSALFHLLEGQTELWDRFFDGWLHGLRGWSPSGRSREGANGGCIGWGRTD